MGTWEPGAKEPRHSRSKPALDQSGSPPRPTSDTPTDPDSALSAANYSRKHGFPRADREYDHAETEKLLGDMYYELEALRRVRDRGRAKFFEDSPEGDDQRRLAQFGIQRFQEAAGRMHSDFKRHHPEVDWRNIRAMRTKIIHQYDEIDDRRVWDGLSYLLDDVATRLQLG